MSYILDALQKSENERQSHVAPEIYRLSRPQEAEHPSTLRWLLLLCLLTLFAVGLSILWQIWGAQNSAAPQPTINAKPVEMAAEARAQVGARIGAKAPPIEASTIAPKPSAQANVFEPKASAQTASRASAAPATAPEPSDAHPSSGKPVLAQKESATEPSGPEQAESRPTVSKPAPLAKTATQQSPQQEKLSESSTVKNMKPARVYSLAELPGDIRASMPSLAFSFHVYASDPSRRTIIINGRRLREGQALNDAMRLRRITPDGVVMAYRNYDIALPVINQW